MPERDRDFDGWEIRWVVQEAAWWRSLLKLLWACAKGRRMAREEAELEAACLAAFASTYGRLNDLPVDPKVYDRVRRMAARMP